MMFKSQVRLEHNRFEKCSARNQGSAIYGKHNKEVRLYDSDLLENECRDNGRCRVVFEYNYVNPSYMNDYKLMGIILKFIFT